MDWALLLLLPIFRKKGWAYFLILLHEQGRNIKRMVGNATISSPQKRFRFDDDAFGDVAMLMKLSTLCLNQANTPHGNNDNDDDGGSDDNGGSDNDGGSDDDNNDVDSPAPSELCV